MATRAWEGKTHMSKKSILIAWLVLSGHVWAQKPEFDFKYESAQDLILNSYLNLDWHGDVFYYRWDSQEGAAIYRSDMSQSASPQVLCTENDLKAELKRAGYTDLENWRLYRFDVDEKKASILFTFKGESLAFNWKTKKLRRRMEKRHSESDLLNRDVINPSSPYKFNTERTVCIYARGHELYMRRLESEPVRLSRDGQQDFSFRLSGNRAVDSLQVGSTHAVWAGKYIVAFREDRRQVADMWVINSLHEPRPTLRTYKFPIPGDTTVSRPVLEIWDSQTRQKHAVDLLTAPDQRIILPGQLVNGRSYLHGPRLGTDAESLYFLRRNRAGNRVELCRLDFEKKEITVLIDEQTDPHFNEQLFAVHILDDDILFWTERSGFGQYDRYSKDGVFQNRVGPAGDYVVGRIHSLDTGARSIIVEVYGFQKGNNPYYRQYLKSDLDSGFGRLLTDLPGYQHEINLSPSRKYFLNRFSSPGTPPIYLVSDTSGSRQMQLGQSDISRLLKLGWIPPEEVEVMAADGETELYGLLYRPTDMNPNMQYPIIASVYPGPQDDYVPRGFSVDDNGHQSLADLGYIVVQVPSRGSSPLRGLRFHGFSYGNLRDYPLADNKHVIEMLARDRPYMDLDHVGIYGHSGGGFMSATALLTYPDFYKVAVAASGNYDPNIYTQWWGETYHGTDSGRGPGYIPTTLELAGNLKGKLLLITGDVDINVHPAQTLRLADALIKENKYFDMMILPGKDHGLGDKYYQNLIRRYFFIHLNNKHDKSTEK